MKQFKSYQPALTLLFATCVLFATGAANPAHAQGYWLHEKRDVVYGKSFGPHPELKFRIEPSAVGEQLRIAVHYAPPTYPAYGVLGPEDDSTVMTYGASFPRVMLPGQKVPLTAEVHFTKAFRYSCAVQFGIGLFCPDHGSGPDWIMYIKTDFKDGRTIKQTAEWTVPHSGGPNGAGSRIRVSQFLMNGSGTAINDQWSWRDGAPPAGDKGFVGTGTTSTGAGATGTGAPGSDAGGTGTGGIGPSGTGTGAGGSGATSAGAGGTGTGAGVGGTGTGSGAGGTGTGSMGSGAVGVAEPAAATQMTLQAGVRKVAVGQTVTVPVWLIQAAAANMNFDVAYDPAVVTLAGAVIKGNLLDKSLFETNTGESGTVKVGIAQGKDLSGTGTVMQIPFKAVGKPGDKSVLRLTVLKAGTASAANASVAVIHGEILIVGPDGQVPGDSDGDGVMTAGDALLALKMSVKLIPAKSNMDIDKDSQATSNDAMLILQKVVGKS